MWKQPECPLMEKGDMVHTYIQYTYIIQPYQEGNPARYDNMDEPGKHCAKWNKPDREGQILHDPT